MESVAINKPTLSWRGVWRWCSSWFTPRPVFEILTDGGTLPTRGSKESAGLDLYCSVRQVVIEPYQTGKVPIGISCSFNPGWAAFIWDRSGMGSKGYHRFAGLIDSDYRGEWGVIIHNTTSERLVIGQYDRVAQVVFQRCWIGRASHGVVKNDTVRGSGGFGSTGA